MKDLINKVKRINVETRIRTTQGGEIRTNRVQAREIGIRVTGLRVQP